MQHVIAATDLTPACEPTIERAALASIAMGAKLHLVHMLPELLPPLVGDSRKAKADRALLFLVQRLRHETGCDVSWKVLQGDRARGIVRASEDIGAVLTVIGHRAGRTTPRALLPTVAERALRLIRNAALIVRDQSGQGDYRKVLLAPEDGIELRSLTSYLHSLSPDASVHQIDLRREVTGRRSTRKVAEHVRAMRRAMEADLLVIGVPRDDTINPFRFRRMLTPLVRAPECDTLVVPQDCTIAPSELPMSRRIRIAS